MIVGHIGGAGAPYEIQKSLRFRASASAYLSRTHVTPTNARIFSFSTWLKRGSLGTMQNIISSTDTANTVSWLRFEGGNTISFVDFNGASFLTNLSTSAVFRDPSAHYHVFVVYDSTQATASDRLKLWINGVAQTLTGITVPLNQASYINTGSGTSNIGREARNAIDYFDGYLSEINFIDGQALDPSYFGEVSAETGSWIPKKYTGTYGTNGFYLPFNDGSSLANLTADRSGNGNNWTANNISLTSGVTYDWMDDTPSNNFAVLNQLDRTNSPAVVLTSANLNANVAGTTGIVKSSFGVSIGKWYWEFLPQASANAVGVVGISRSERLSDWRSSSGFGYEYTGQKATNNSKSNYGATYTSGDVIGAALDLDAGTVEFFKNGVSQGVAFTGISGTFSASIQHNGAVTGAWDCIVNFGQRPFAYTPPAGFKALCTKNLPTPNILNPKKHFDVVLATGANIKSTAEAVFPSNFLEWIKDRGNANNHQLIDIVRGTSAVLQSNTTSAETTYSAPSGSSVGWLWKAGGAPVTNTAGSIQSQVSANPQAGFSIVTYTGTGANATVGHGLGVAPKMVLCRVRSGVSDWPVWHTSFPGTDYILLDTTAAKATYTGFWNSQVPTSSVVNLGSGDSNRGTATMVAYCFAEVPGYSKLGSYVGNGSADGPFVYCGFRPAYVLIKCSSTTGNWVVIDCKRAGYNVDNDPLYANLSNAEATTDLIDITSNGFKVRSTNADVGAVQTYIFAAFAEQPFQFANAR